MYRLSSKFIWVYFLKRNSVVIFNMERDNLKSGLWNIKLFLDNKYCRNDVNCKKSREGETINCLHCKMENKIKKSKKKEFRKAIWKEKKRKAQNVDKNNENSIINYILFGLRTNKMILEFSPGPKLSNDVHESIWLNLGGNFVDMWSSTICNMFTNLHIYFVFPEGGGLHQSHLQNIRFTCFNYM